MNDGIKGFRRKVGLGNTAVRGPVTQTLKRTDPAGDPFRRGHHSSQAQPGTRGTRCLPASSELVADIDTVDPRVNRNREGFRIDSIRKGCIRFDADPAQVEIEHPIVVHHIVGADLRGNANRIVQIKRESCQSLVQIRVKKRRVVETQSGIRLEPGVRCKVILNRERWWEMIGLSNARAPVQEL